MREIKHKFHIYSHTSSDKYIVSQYTDGSWACSCPHWKFSRGHKIECKHILEAKNELNLLEQKQKHILELKNKYFPEQEIMISVTGLNQTNQESESKSHKLVESTSNLSTNTQMKCNCERDLCAKCRENKGEVPINDEYSTFWICDYCDSEMFDNSIDSKGLEPRAEQEVTINICSLNDKTDLERESVMTASRELNEVENELTRT